MKGFKKDRGGFVKRVKRVEEFVMPFFKLANDRVQEIPAVSNEPSELLKQMSLLVDKKIFDAQIAAGEMLAGINDEITALKKGKAL